MKKTNFPDGKLKRIILMTRLNSLLLMALKLKRKDGNGNRNSTEPCGPGTAAYGGTSALGGDMYGEGGGGNE